jgi:hypothetical protein
VRLSPREPLGKSGEFAIFVGKGEGVKGSDSMAIASDVGSASNMLAIVHSEHIARTPASVPDEPGNCDRSHPLPIL